MNYNNVLNIVHQNIRVFSYFTYDVIIFTESWLTNEILNAEVLCDSHQKYKHNCNSRIEYGILIAVPSLYLSEIIATHSDDMISSLSN